MAAPTRHMGTNHQVAGTMTTPVPHPEEDISVRYIKVPSLNNEACTTTRLVEFLKQGDAQNFLLKIEHMKENHGICSWGTFRSIQSKSIV